MYNGNIKYQIKYNSNIKDLNYNEWHNYIVVFDNNILSTVVDGISQGTLISVEYKPASGGSFGINCSYKSTMDGDMLKDIRLYHSILSKNDMKEIYNMGNVFNVDAMLYSYSITENTEKTDENKKFEITKNGVYANTITDSNKYNSDFFSVDSNGNIILPYSIVETY
jgi:hypothetical protein